jgi:DNA primase
MKPDQAKAFLKALGSKPHYDGGKWVKSDCPLAPFTHQNHKDTNPSFGVSVEPNKHSAYNCFTCHNGSVEELLQTIEMYCGQNPMKAGRYNIKAARELLESEEVAVQSLGDYTEFGESGPVFQEWPEWFINSFVRAEFNAKAYQYLEGRGVTPAQIAKHNLRYDSKREMIVHPYKNVYGHLAGARGRSIHNHLKGHTKFYDYTWNEVNNASLVWYNEPAIDTEEPIIIVEGQFDLYTVERVWPHVIANLTGKPVPTKMKKLSHVSGAILMLDNDPTADVAVQKYLEFFARDNIQYAVIQPPKLSDENGKLIKQDPHSMGEEWVREQLKQLLPV